VGGQVEIANDYRKALRRACKTAWLGEGDSNGDLGFVDEQFWSVTERDFYAMIDSLKRDVESRQQRLNAEDCQQWLVSLKRRALSLFDALVLSDASQTEHIERKLRARRSLEWVKLNKAYLQKHGLDKERVASV